MQIRNILTLLVLVATVSGCASRPYWTLTDTANKVVQSKTFEITLPEGWNRNTVTETKERINTGSRFRDVRLERLITSRDGTDIHAIIVTRRELDFAFPTIKKKGTADMQPIEAADLYLSDLRKRTGLERLKVLSNKPAQVNGKPAFHLVIEFKNDDGLRIRIVSHGFVDNTGFYTINYRAPVLHYYARDYADYAGAVRSFRKL